MAEIYRVELRFEVDERELKVFVKEMGKGAEVVKEFDRSIDVAAESVSELELRLSSLDKQMDRLSKLEGIFRDVAIAGVAMAYAGEQILDRFLGIGGELVEEAAQYEYMGGIFGILLGDVEVGRAFNEQLDELTKNLKGVYTPEVQAAAMTMIGFGLSHRETLEYMDDMALAALTSKKPLGDLVMQVARLADPSLRGQTATQLAAFGLVIEDFGKFAGDEAMTVGEAFAEMARYVQENIGESVSILDDTVLDCLRKIEAHTYRIKRDIGLELLKVIEGPLAQFADWLGKISKDPAFKEWTAKFVKGLKDIGVALLYILKAAKWAFQPIIDFLKEHPRIAGWIAGLTGLGAVILIVGGKVLALYGGVGMLIMSKKALMLEVKRYQIEGQIAARIMQDQSAQATGLAGSLQGATLAQAEYNTQLELFNEQQLASTGVTKDFTSAQTQAGDSSLGLIGILGKLGIAYIALKLQMEGVNWALDWFDKKVLGMEGGTRELPMVDIWYKTGGFLGMSPKEFAEKYPEHPATIAYKEQLPPRWERGLDEFRWRQAEDFAPVSPEEVYGGGGAGGDGRATATGPQINTYYITQHFEDSSVQILPEGEYDAEAFLTDMEALAPG